MNIFVLNQDPVKAAQLHCDRHVIKMILESAQMLCTSILFYDNTKLVAYNQTHTNHPCSIWARATVENFMWLVFMSKELAREHQLRYPKSKEHKSAQVIRECEKMYKVIPSGPLTDFAQAMPDQYKGKCAVVAYQKYYKGEKAGFATWKSPRSIPSFMDSK